MGRTLLAFLGLIFAIYWISTADQELLNPITPALVRVRPAMRAPSATDDPNVLRERAQSLTVEELMWLETFAFNSKAPSAERLLAVDMIGYSPLPQALDGLKEIGMRPIYVSSEDRNYSTEVGVRARALDSLIHRLPASESVLFLRNLLEKTSDPGVARHVQHWLSLLG